jgi:hypothetical protein
MIIVSVTREIEDVNSFRVNARISKLNHLLSQMIVIIYNHRNQEKQDYWQVNIGLMKLQIKLDFDLSTPR